MGRAEAAAPPAAGAAEEEEAGAAGADGAAAEGPRRRHLRGGGSGLRAALCQERMCPRGVFRGSRSARDRGTVRADATISACDG